MPPAATQGLGRKQQKDMPPLTARASTPFQAHSRPPPPTRHPHLGILGIADEPVDRGEVLALRELLVQAPEHLGSKRTVALVGRVLSACRQLPPRPYGKHGGGLPTQRRDERNKHDEDRTNASARSNSTSTQAYARTCTMARVALVTGSEKSPPGGLTAPTMVTEPSRLGEPRHTQRPARS